MNLPNKITLFRIMLIPFFIFFMLVDLSNNEWIALIIFTVACCSDALDGYLARKNNQITDFGKFMDPLADKLLVSSALICFVERGQVPSWIVITIIAREFIISGVRLIAAKRGVVIAASNWAKGKTTFQMIMCIIFIAEFDKWKWLDITGQVVMYIALVLTVISLVDYLIKNKNVLSGASK